LKILISKLTALTIYQLIQILKNIINVIHNQATHTIKWYSFTTPSKHSTINILQYIFFLFLSCKIPLS